MRIEARPWYRIGAVVVLALAATGCAPGTGAPRGWLPEAEQSLHDTYGGWLRLRSSGDPEQTLQGEFLAVDADSVYVLTAEGFAAVPVKAVESATVSGYDPQVGSVRGWVAGGSLAALSHGFAAIFSVPLWLGVGSAAAHAQARVAIVPLRDHDWGHLCKYARFPQGPPPAIRSLRLRLRPYYGILPVRTAPPPQPDPW
jgi:hypothetical protein